MLTLLVIAALVVAILTGCRHATRPAERRRLPHRITIGALLGVGLLAFTGTAAAAADSGLVVEGASEFVITKPAWTIITGLLLPFVVALITKASASSTFKGVVGIVLAALAAIIERATLTDGTAVFTSALLLDILLVYGPQLLTYLGLWGQIDINSKIAPNAGLG